MEFTSELLQTISKRAWKFSPIFLLYIVICVSVLFFIIVSEELYNLEVLKNTDEIYIEILSYCIKSSISAFLIYLILFMLKGDSDSSIKEKREIFYKKAYKRVQLVFNYRYNFSIENYSDEIRVLTEYNKLYKKNDITHTINKSNLNYFIVEGVDSLYIRYKISNTEEILYSVWHSGKFIAIAIAIKKFNAVLEINKISYLYENTLNLTGSNNIEKERLSEREGYWWFDIKYDTDEEFLFNNLSQEDISRKIAHIVTVGLKTSLEILGWEEYTYEKNINTI